MQPSRRVPVRVLLTLSLRYWRRRLGRAAAGVLGIALGVALVVAVVAVNRAVESTYSGWVETLAAKGSLEVRAVQSGGASSQLLDVVRAVPGVQAASAAIEQRSYVFTAEQQTTTIVRGIDGAGASTERGLRLLAGRRLDSADVNSTVLSAGAAEALAVSVGGTVSLLSAEGLLDLTVVGVVAGLELEGPARNNLALVPLRTAQEAFFQGRDVVNRIDVLPGIGSDLETLSTRLQEQLGAVALVRQPADELQELATATTGLRILLLLSAVMALVAALFLIGTNLAAASEERTSDLGVVRALGLRARSAQLWYLAEAAAMGAVGSVGGAALGVLGSRVMVRHLPSDLLLAGELPTLNLGVDLWAAVGGALAGIVVTVLVALPEALRVTRRAGTMVAAAAAPRRRLLPGLLLSGGLLLGTVLLLALLRHWPAAWGGAEDSAVVKPLLVMALVLACGLSLSWTLPRLFGGLSAGVRSLPDPPLWLRLATDSLRRHARRTGATSVSLSITLASMVGVYGAVDSYGNALDEWLDATVTWDLLVRTGSTDNQSEQPLPAALAQTLATVPGVLAALSERSVTVSAGGRAVELIAFASAADRPSRRLKVVSGLELERAALGGSGAARGRPEPRGSSPALAAALAQAGGVALSPALAARLGVAPGSALTLLTPAGERSFEVVALVEDRATEAGGAYLDAAVYAQAFADPFVDEVGVQLAANARAPEVLPLLLAAAHEHLGNRYPVQVVSSATFRGQVLAGLGATFAVVRALLLVAVLVALVGLLNAMLIGFWQLRRQFGLLRALGAPVKIVVRTLVTEALLTAAAGAVTGLLLGTLLSFAVLDGLTAPQVGPLPSWSPPYGAYLDVLALLLPAVLLCAALVLAAVRFRRSAVALRLDRR